MKPFLKYLVSGIIVWVIVDFTTAFNPNITRWINHMPDIWVFYIGYPLLFAYLTYNKKWNDRKIVLAMLLSAFILEVVLSNNALLYTFPIMLIMNPIAVAIYTFVTFIPKWYTEGTIRKNDKKIYLLGLIWIIVSILNFITNARTI
jgi:hypothetical protein